MLRNEKGIAMLKSHVKFNSIAGKRMILIVDDEQINREMLGFITKDDYEVLYAQNGREALELMRENADFLSLVLLDLNMPEVTGFEVMETAKKEKTIAGIPIIVLTSEDQAEVQSLEMGASDFITKPFDMPKVILTRMQKTIELHEDRTIIQMTEREDMTGLFNRDFFYRYGEQYDRFHPEQPMDAVAIDINHFHLINELYGRRRGDEVLIHLAGYLKELREQTGCMACRIEADRFLVYMPGGMVDYDSAAKEINEHFNEFKDINVRVRTGIYRDVDKTIDIERRFDRAVQAVNLIKGNYAQLIAVYDVQAHEKKIFEDRLISEADEALEGGQFYLKYQPKYNITGDQPVLASAEVLVRWEHPQLGAVSPSVFIPLMEDNGLISKLDAFVWKEAMAHVERWKAAGVSVPISINISRMDLYNPNLVNSLSSMLHEHRLDKSDVYLEITESSYTDDVDWITQVIDGLHQEGFVIEMDDFGSGYSSLNMLADIPMDVLKMDMAFVQRLRHNNRQETLIRLIMDVAKDLDMLVVAEGVEDQEQVDFLKSVNCDLIQGYYFSKPLAAEEFETLLKERVKV